MPERKNGTELSAVEPVIVCPNCKKEIRLTESLAGPLVEATRRQYEQKLQEVNSAIAEREAAVRRQEKVVTEAQNAVDDHIAQGIRKEREKIAAEEARRARLLVSDELQGKSKEIADLEKILKTKDDKLAEAQSAQAEVVRKQRELDDAKREVDLTVETRVNQSLATVRQKAKHEAEEELKLKVEEKEETIAGMQTPDRGAEAQSRAGFAATPGRSPGTGAGIATDCEVSNRFNRTGPERSLVVTFCSTCSTTLARPAECCSGNRNERRTGAMHGLRSSARISEPLRLILRSWFLVCCPKASTFSITSMESGCSTRNASFPSRSHFDNL